MTLQQQEQERIEYLVQEKMIGDLTQYQACEECEVCGRPIRYGKYTDIVAQKIPAIYNREFDMYIATNKDDVTWYHKNCQN